MSRIDEAFERFRGVPGLIPYVTAGYPSAAVTLELMLGLARAGARAIELGVPFSDPIADGPEIQRASEWALRGGTGPDEALDLARRFRAESDVPVVLMSYANPVLREGAEAFATAARAAGIDGVLLSDLPPDESPDVWRALDEAGLATVVLVAPTTPEPRLELLLTRCRGFVYCLARTGVTGRSAGDSGPLAERVGALRKRTPLPIAVGFGISTPEQAREAGRVADAIVVGAAFMSAIHEDPERGAAERVTRLAGEMLAALKG